MQTKSMCKALWLGLSAAFLASAGFAQALEPVDARLPDQKAQLKPIPGSDLLLEIPADLREHAGHFDVAATAPGIRFAVLPNPRNWEGGRGITWSTWGDATLASDGKFYCSYGDHVGPHGASYVCLVDPATGAIELTTDFNKALPDRRPDQYTPGKIHASIVDGGDGYLYFPGYRGTMRSTNKEDDYTGNWLLRYNLESGLTENLGILLPDSCVPVMYGWARGNMLYGLSVPGATMFPPRNMFYAYNTAEQKVVFAGGPMSLASRMIAVTRDGRVFYDGQDQTDDGEVVNVLIKYDPAKNEVEPTGQQIPGNGQLRAASPENDDGIIVMMDGRGLIYLFDAKTEKILPETFWALYPPDGDGGRHLYICALTMDPSGRFVYGVPGAHGNAWRFGTPIIQWDIKTRRPKVIAFLNEFMQQQAETFLGGTYGVALSADGSQLFVSWNGGRAPRGGKLNHRQAAWQQVMAMVIDIPEGER